MAQIDKANAYINYLKFWLGIAVAVVLGILGWIFTSYEKASVFLLCGGVVLVIVFVALAYHLNKRVRQKIDELEHI